jgi:hypothetical protein
MLLRVPASHIESGKWRSAAPGFDSCCAWSLELTWCGSMADRERLAGLEKYFSIAAHAAGVSIGPAASFPAELENF